MTAPRRARRSSVSSSRRGRTSGTSERDPSIGVRPGLRGRRDHRGGRRVAPRCAARHPCLPRAGPVAAGSTHRVMSRRAAIRRCLARSIEGCGRHAASTSMSSSHGMPLPDNDSHGCSGRAPKADPNSPSRGSSLVPIRRRRWSSRHRRQTTSTVLRTTSSSSRLLATHC